MYKPKVLLEYFPFQIHIQLPWIVSADKWNTNRGKMHLVLSVCPEVAVEGIYTVCFSKVVILLRSVVPKLLKSQTTEKDGSDGKLSKSIDNFGSLPSPPLSDLQSLRPHFLLELFGIYILLHDCLHQTKDAPTTRVLCTY